MDSLKYKKMVVIRQCSCEHDFQDKAYGKQMRLHNVGKDVNSEAVQVTCTVCGKKSTTSKKNICS